MISLAQRRFVFEMTADNIKDTHRKVRALALTQRIATLKFWESVVFLPWSAGTELPSIQESPSQKIPGEATRRLNYPDLAGRLTPGVRRKPDISGGGTERVKLAANGRKGEEVSALSQAEAETSKPRMDRKARTPANVETNNPRSRRRKKIIRVEGLPRQERLAFHVLQRAGSANGVGGVRERRSLGL